MMTYLNIYHQSGVVQENICDFKKLGKFLAKMK